MKTIDKVLIGLGALIGGVTMINLFEDYLDMKKVVSLNELEKERIKRGNNSGGSNNNHPKKKNNN